MFATVGSQEGGRALRLLIPVQRVRVHEEAGVRRGTRIVVATVATVIIGAWAASLAFAAGPPSGTYYCSSGYSLKILKSHYRFTVAPGGNFTYAAATHKLTFTSGYLKRDWYGKFRRDATSHSPIIDLFLKDGSGGDSCYQ
jgi:hypothetical protein